MHQYISSLIKILRDLPSWCHLDTVSSSVFDAVGREAFNFLKRLIIFVLGDTRSRILFWISRCLAMFLIYWLNCLIQFIVSAIFLIVLFVLFICRMLFLPGLANYLGQWIVGGAHRADTLDTLFDLKRTDTSGDHWSVIVNRRHLGCRDASSAVSFRVIGIL